MIYGAIERAALVTEANFETILAALFTANSIDRRANSSVTVYKRRPAAIFMSEPLPGIGIYWDTGRTSAKEQDRREGTVNVVFEYAARLGFAELLEAQTELAVEALFQVIDLLPGAYAGNPSPGAILGAGEPRDSLEVLTTGPNRADGMDYSEDRAIVIAPLILEVTGL